MTFLPVPENMSICQYGYVYQDYKFNTSGYSSVYMSFDHVVYNMTGQG